METYEINSKSEDDSEGTKITLTLMGWGMPSEGPDLHHQLIGLFYPISLRLSFPELSDVK